MDSRGFTGVRRRDCPPAHVVFAWALKSLGGSCIHCCSSPRRNPTFTSTTAPEQLHTGPKDLYHQLFIRLYYNNTHAHLRTRLRLPVKERQTAPKHTDLASRRGLPQNITNTIRAPCTNLIAQHINHNGRRSRTSGGQEPYAG